MMTETATRTARPRTIAVPEGNQSTRLQNQAFLAAVSAAASEDQARIVAEGRRPRETRQPALAQHQAFIDAVRAICWRKRDLANPRDFYALRLLARETAVPDYDPIDDFGVMTPILEAAASGDFVSMRRIAAESVYPVEKARGESLRRRHGLKILLDLARADFPPDARLLQAIARRSAELLAWERT